METLEAIASRRDVREFEDRPLPDDVLGAILVLQELTELRDPMAA